MKAFWSALYAKPLLHMQSKYIRLFLSRDGL
nr:MAG TPA: hypothetical protein [Caudoviricetes sp.]